MMAERGRNYDPGPSQSRSPRHWRWRSSGSFGASDAGKTTFTERLLRYCFEARPVIAVEEAVRGELEVIAWRDGLKRT
jgi:hypothetical protein